MISRSVRIQNIRSALFPLIGAMALYITWNFGTQERSSDDYTIGGEDDYVTDNSSDTNDVKSILCQVNYMDGRKHIQNSPHLKMIYYVTPTYRRAGQVPEIIRLSHTLMHVPRIHWIIADDWNICNEAILKVLRKSSLPFTFISTSRKRSNFRDQSNRRAAMQWVQKNIKEGVLYSNDDDNTVDLELFDELRKTIKVSMFPVGLLGKYGISSPIVQDGKVRKLFDAWEGNNNVLLDMTGIAVDIEFLNTTEKILYSKRYQGIKFLRDLGLKIGDIEPLADNCSKILVWHTKSTITRATHMRVNMQIKWTPDLDSFADLLTELANIGLAKLNPHYGFGLDYFFQHLP